MSRPGSGPWVGARSQPLAQGLRSSVLVAPGRPLLLTAASGTLGLQGPAGVEGWGAVPEAVMHLHFREAPLNTSGVCVFGSSSLPSL